MVAGQDRQIGGGRYELLEVVGQGGVGTVYRAVQRPLGRLVALKVLRPELADRAGVRRRFSQEARAVASLNHPNIATVFDFGVEDDGTLYLAMEYVAGVPMSALLGPSMTPAWLLAILDPMLAGLAHAHARGVIHRDLKPDNLLVGYEPGTTEVPGPEALARHPERVKLVDFGIATVGGRASWSLGETGEGEVIGTPLYMAPEQARGERTLTPAVDIYALGVLLFEGLTGRHPFAGLEPDETAMDVLVRHVTVQAPEVQVPPGVYMPEALRAVVRRCLQKRPEERFNSAAALREALLECAVLLQVHRTGTLGLLDEGRPLARAVELGASATAPRPLAARADSRKPGDDTPVASIPEGQPRKVRFEAPLVGRAEERARLEAVAARCLDAPAGRIVLLEGEAGVGKTKLATWLKEQVLEAGRMRCITGAFLRESGGLRGVREALESLFGVRHMSREQIQRRLDEVLPSWGDGESIDRQGLAEFLRPMGVEVRPEGGDQGALFALLGRVLERAARVEPLMILLDDIQWAGPELGVLLEYLAVEFRYRETPLLVVCTVRIEDLPESPALAEGLQRLARYDGETVARLVLERMDEGDSRKLLQEIMPLAEGVQAQISARGAGNPLHLVQLLQYLYEEGALRWDEAKGRFVGSGGRQGTLARVPPSLADLIELRLAQIERRHQTGGVLARLLERCAVLGSDFTFDGLAQLLALEGDDALSEFLEIGIDLLVQEGVLIQLKGRRLETLRFNHGLIREALLGKLTGLSRYRRLHSLAGRAKEEVHRNHLDEVALAIAHHALEAGEQERALSFLLKAGLSARAGHRLADAEELLKRAAALAAQVHPPEAPIHLTLARRIGSLQLGFGRLDDAERTFTRLLRSALMAGESLPLESEEASGEPGEAPEAPEATDEPRDPHGPLTGPERHLLMNALDHSPRLSALGPAVREDVVRAVYGMAQVARRQGRQDAALKLVERGLTMARQGKQQPWVDHGLLQLGWLAWERGDYDEAERLGGGALDRAVEEGNPYNRADALHLLAEVARLRNDPARTAELLTRAREAFEILDDRRHVAECLRDLAQLARARQDLEHAARLFTEARQRFEALGDRHAVAACLNGLGEVARFMGRLPVAESCYRRAWETFRSLGASVDAALALTNLGLAAMAGGQFDAADDAFSRAEVTIADLDRPYLVAGLRLNQALLRTRQHRLDDAERNLDEAVALIDRHGLSDPDYARPLQELGEILREAGRQERGQAMLDRARAMWAVLGLSEPVPE